MVRLSKKRTKRNNYKSKKGKYKKVRKTKRISRKRGGGKLFNSLKDKGRRAKEYLSKKAVGLVQAEAENNPKMREILSRSSKYKEYSDRYPNKKATEAVEARAENNPKMREMYSKYKEYSDRYPIPRPGILGMADMLSMYKRSRGARSNALRSNAP